MTNTSCPSNTNSTLYDDVNMTLSTNDNVSCASPPSGLDWQFIMTHSIYLTVKDLTHYRYYLLLPLAVLGNTLCFTIFYRHMRTNCAYFFLGQVALWDMITVVIKAIKYFLDINFVALGTVGCKFSAFLVAFCPVVSVWLIVIMTCDRLFVVTSSFRYKRHCSLKIAYITYLALIVFMVVFEAQEFVTMGMLEIPGIRPVKFRCQIYPQYEFFYGHIWTKIYYSVFTVIPVILLTVLNILLVRRVRRKLDRMSERSTGSSEVAKRHVTRMSVTVSVVFILCNVPQCLLFLLRSFGYDFRSSEMTFLRYLIVNHVAFTLQILNHCVNIFLYFLSGRRFRHDVIFLFRWRRLPSLTVSGRAHPLTTKQTSTTSVTKTINISLAVKTKS